MLSFDLVLNTPAAERLSTEKQVSDSSIHAMEIESESVFSFSIYADGKLNLWIKLL